MWSFKTGDLLKEVGWIIGQFGPSFLDLQIITHTRLEQGSAFMTAHSVGYLIGSLVSGILFDRFNKILLIFFTIFGNAVTVASLKNIIKVIVLKLMSYNPKVQK
jgi:MFS family permease